MTLTVGTFLGATVIAIGYKWAFVFNALSFVFSAWCIWHLRAPDAQAFARRARSDRRRGDSALARVSRRTALHALGAAGLAIALLSVGWATGGGAAQILFTLFGEVVFNRGAGGIGMIWGCAGLGLLSGGVVANWLGKRLSFNGYKLAVFIDYVVHGALMFCSAVRSSSSWRCFSSSSRAAAWPSTRS